jgi:carbamoyltransferase
MMSAVQILGISCYYHDAAAALVRDGAIVAAAAEERFTRRKHDSGFPRRAIDYCLAEGKLRCEELDYVVFYEKPIVKFDRILASALTTWPRSYVSFLRALPLWLRSRLRVGKEIASLGDGPTLLYSDHHLSHAAVSFLCSPFERAAILTLDGVGEWACACSGVGEGGRVTLEREMRYPHSLGLLYSALTAYLGFEVNDAEWKVMGLAPYGEPRYLDRLQRLVHVAEDGTFQLDMRYFSYHWSSRRMYSRAFVELLGEPPREPEAELSDFHRDVARSAQALVEGIILRLAASTAARYGTDALCLGGGVGLNCVANWKILAETPVRRLFVHPATGDDGGSVGAALNVYHQLLGNDRRVAEAAMPYWGPAFTDDAIEGTLRAAGASYRVLDREALLSLVAEQIHAGRVIGWFQGRMEFGPRALGNRSILASPLRAEMKDIINAKIKFREFFRPFAPAVLQERAADYFELGALVDDAPYMLLAAPVRPEKRAVIPAVTHADGTGRLQTVRREQNPLYYDLLRRVEQVSGVPVVINTSFNVRGEPIVCTPQDAYACFAKSGIDLLVMGNTVTAKDGVV